VISVLLGRSIHVPAGSLQKVQHALYRTVFGKTGVSHIFAPLSGILRQEKAKRKVFFT